MGILSDESSGGEKPDRLNWKTFLTEVDDALWKGFGPQGSREIADMLFTGQAYSPGMGDFDISPMGESEIKPPNMGDNSIHGTDQPTQESAAPGQNLVEVNQAVFDPQQTIEPPRMDPPAIEGMVIDNPPQRGMDMEI